MFRHATNPPDIRSLAAACGNTVAGEQALGCSEATGEIGNNRIRACRDSVERALRDTEAPDLEGDQEAHGRRSWRFAAGNGGGNSTNSSVEQGLEVEPCSCVPFLRDSSRLNERFDQVAQT